MPADHSGPDPQREMLALEGSWVSNSKGKWLKKKWAGRQERSGKGRAQQLANWNGDPRVGGLLGLDNVLRNGGLRRPSGIMIELVEVRSPLNEVKRRREMKALV